MGYFLSAAQKYNGQKIEHNMSGLILVLEIYAAEELERFLMIIKVIDFVNYNK